jgi:transposase
MYPFYLGLDLHLKKTYAVLLDAQGNTLDERHVANEELPTYLHKVVPPRTYAVLEATRNWPFLYDLLAEHVERVELAHPKELKAISSAAVKTDRIDARVLAQLARLNYLPVAYAAPATTRDLRLLMRHRCQLVWARTRAKNRIHALLARYNLVAPVTDLFGAQGREILEQELCLQLRPAAKKILSNHLSLIDYLNEQIVATEAAIDLTPEQKQAVRLLITIPGVGQTIAHTIIAEIGEIRRFHSPKALCNWAGLTPRVRQSAAIIHHGSISKQGSPYLRAAMTQAATIASRFSRRWYTVYERLAGRCGKRAAKVAVARRLLTVGYYMLKRNEPYQEDYQTNRRGA